METTYTITTTDRQEANRLIKSLDMAIALSDFREELRKILKYNEDPKFDAHTIEHIRSSFNDLLQQRGIHIDDLIS